MSRLSYLGFAVLEYRPDPTKPNEGRIPLGIILEAVQDRFESRGRLAYRDWYVGIKARAFLSVEEKKGLDEIGAELLAKPLDFLSGEIEEILGSLSAYELRHLKPGGVLARICERNPYSIHGRTPKVIASRWPGSVQNKLDRAMSDLYAQHVMGIAVSESTGDSTILTFPEVQPQGWAGGSKLYTVPVGAST